MRRVIVGAPGLLNFDVAPQSDAWTVVNDRARIFEVQQTGEPGMPELPWLGLPADFASIADGPLAAAAFGAFPPERSVVFQVSFLGLDEHDVICGVELSPEESESFVNLMVERLGEKNWTFVRGEGGVHGLVHERGSIDLACAEPSALMGSSWEPDWPEGDFADRLRTLVLDSRELFEASDINRRRAGDGLPRIGFAWPWGPGLMHTLPNLAVSRGELVRYLSPWLRLKGAARLAGYWHGNLGQSRDEGLRGMSSFSEPMIAIFPINNGDEAERFYAEIEEFLFNPMVLKKNADDLRLTIIGFGDRGNIGFNYDSRRLDSNSVPFDLRALGDARNKVFPLYEAVLIALSQ